jgi:hypothetical protein
VVGVAGAGEEEVAIRGAWRDGRKFARDGDSASGPVIIGGGKAKILGFRVGRDGGGADLGGRGDEAARWVDGGDGSTRCRDWRKEEED